MFMGCDFVGFICMYMEWLGYDGRWMENFLIIVGGINWFLI